MAKISRPILYTAVLGAVAFAAVLLTEPEPPARKPSARATRAASPIPGGFTEADLTARFARYSGSPQDAFRPKIVPAKQDASAQAASSEPGTILDGTGAKWILTGISVLDGVRSALLENASTKEAIFVESGDIWNGLRVASVESNAAVFVNLKGETRRIAFIETAPDAAPGARASAAAPTAGPANRSAAPAAPSGNPAPAANPRVN